MKESIVAIALLAPAEAHSTADTCPARGSDTFFFPSGSFDPDSRNDKFTGEWFSKHLKAMGEPSLSCGLVSGQEKVYRFIWLRTFHHPIVVRITVKQDVASIDAVELDGAGGYEPGKELRRVSRRIPAPQSSEVSDRLERLWAYIPEARELGMDGSEWVFESRADKAYKVVDAWSPDDGLVRELGEYALSLAGFDIPINERY